MKQEHDVSPADVTTVFTPSAPCDGWSVRSAVGWTGGLPPAPSTDAPRPSSRFVQVSQVDLPPSSGGPAARTAAARNGPSFSPMSLAPQQGFWAGSPALPLSNRTAPSPLAEADGNSDDEVLMHDAASVCTIDSHVCADRKRPLSTTSEPYLPASTQGIGAPWPLRPPPQGPVVQHRGNLSGLDCPPRLRRGQAPLL